MCVSRVHMDDICCPQSADPGKTHVRLALRFQKVVRIFPMSRKSIALSVCLPMYYNPFYDTRALMVSYKKRESEGEGEKENEKERRGGGERGGGRGCARLPGTYLFHERDYK